jgi:hypothetical protein
LKRREFKNEELQLVESKYYKNVGMEYEIRPFSITLISLLPNAD